MSGDASGSASPTKSVLAVVALLPTIAAAVTGFLAYQVDSEVKGLRAQIDWMKAVAAGA